VITTSISGGGGGAGGGVSGLTAADGGTAIADNAIVRGQGTTGIQGSSVTLSSTTGAVVQLTANTGFSFTPNGTGRFLWNSTNLFQIGGTTSSAAGFKAPNAAGILSLRNGDDTGYAIVNGQRFRAWQDESNISVTLMATLGVELGSDRALAFSASLDATAAKDSHYSRRAAGDHSFDTATKGNGLGVLSFGGGRCRGLTSSAGAASITEYPTAGDWGIHTNTSTGAVHIVYNGSGTIKSAQLT
jgi:hypothetical protein